MNTANTTNTGSNLVDLVVALQSELDQLRLEIETRKAPRISTLQAVQLAWATFKASCHSDNR